MNIQSYNKVYSVDIIDSLDIAAITNGIKYLIVVDKAVFTIYQDTLFKQVDHENVILIEANENNKTIDAALELCRRMAEVSFKRNSTLISIGGGIIQDVTGFAANIYNRGVKWIFIPTTLLAQCDSCIGAKTSLNYLRYKNILGTFYAPDQVLIDLNLVLTLSEDDYRSGLGEIAKFNIMAAVDGIDLLENNLDKLLGRNIEVLSLFLKRSLVFKKKFIEADEFDKGPRNLLNFAHTFGHAFETVSQYAVPHGQAVTLGLITANLISCNRGILDSALKNRIEQLCIRLVSVQLCPQWFDADNIIEAMKKDKKQTSDNLTVVLFKNDLQLEIVNDLQPVEVQRALNQLLKILELKVLG